MAVTCGHWAGRTGGRTANTGATDPAYCTTLADSPCFRGRSQNTKTQKKTTNKKTHSEHSLNPSLQKRTGILNHLEDMWCLFFPESCDIYTHRQVGFVTIQKISNRPERKRRKKKKGKVTSDSQVRFSLSLFSICHFLKVKPVYFFSLIY